MCLSILKIAEEKIASQADADNYDPADNGSDECIFVSVLPVYHVRNWWFFKEELVLSIVYIFEFETLAAAIFGLN